MRAEWQNSISRGGDILLLPPRKWLVGEWLPLNALGIIYAEAGTGKSFYALSLALELARGGAWCGTQLKEPLEVLYVAGERINDLRDRAEAWSRHYEAELPAALSFMHPLSTPQLRSLHCTWQGPAQTAATRACGRVPLNCSRSKPSFRVPPPPASPTPT